MTTVEILAQILPFIHTIEPHGSCAELGGSESKHRLLCAEYEDESGLEWSDPGQIRLHWIIDDVDNISMESDVTTTLEDLAAIIQRGDAKIYKLEEITLH